MCFFCALIASLHSQANAQRPSVQECSCMVQISSHVCTGFWEENDDFPCSNSPCTDLAPDGTCTLVQNLTTFYVRPSEEEFNTPRVRYVPNEGAPGTMMRTGTDFPCKEKKQCRNCLYQPARTGIVAGYYCNSVTIEKESLVRYIVCKYQAGNVLQPCN